MMVPTPVLFVLLPGLTAALMLVFARDSVERQRTLGLLGAGLQLVLAIWALVAMTAGAEPLSYILSGWNRAMPGDPTVGIELRMDALSALMVFATAVIGFTAACVYPSMLKEQETRGAWPLTAFLLMGVNLAFVTNDLFNLFVSFEVLLLSSYGLLAGGVGGRKARHVITYLAVNLIASTVFLVAAGFAYAATGTLNLTDMAARIVASGGGPSAPLTVVALLLLFVYASKSAVFPLFGWMPEAYSVLRGPVMGLFGGLLTKVGVYALLRVLIGGLGSANAAPALELLAILALPTMFLGGLATVSRSSFRGIMAFSIVAQIGYLIFGLSMGTAGAVVATIFFLVHNMLAKSALFFIGSAMEIVTGAPDDDIHSFGGLWRTHPMLGLCFLVAGMSLAGLPPFSGFWGKFLLVQEGLRGGHWFLVTAALIASFFTMFAVLRIWLTAFWGRREHRGSAMGNALTTRDQAGLLVIVGAIITLGLGAGWFLQGANLAQEQLAVYHHDPIAMAEGD